MNCSYAGIIGKSSQNSYVNLSFSSFIVNLAENASLSRFGAVASTINAQLFVENVIIMFNDLLMNVPSAYYTIQIGGLASLI
jgi:hypothetical protein